MSRRTKLLSIAAILFVAAAIGWLTLGPKVLSRISNMAPPGMASAKLELGSFPVIDQSGLSQTQRSIVAVTKAEHAAQSDYAKYTEGAREAWCASFASWVMKEAAVPYSNPHSGHWRIPGTLTLREYYESEDRFRPIDSGYVPKVGDIVLYDGPGWFGQHANIVIQNNDGKLTTVGGNEVGKVRVQTRDVGIQGAVGYGILPEPSA